MDPESGYGGANSGEYGKTYPPSILLGPWIFARTSHSLIEQFIDRAIYSSEHLGQEPVPERLMLCGLVGSLPMFTAMLALSSDPPPVGVKVTAIVHDEFASAVAPHVPPSLRSRPRSAR